jgi:hypothetical protein
MVHKPYDGVVNLFSATWYKTCRRKPDRQNGKPPEGGLFITAVERKTNRLLLYHQDALGNYFYLNL